MSDLQLKASRISRDDGSDVKDYLIKADGREFLAINDGKSKFTCPDAGVNDPKPLKEVKMAIAVAVESARVESSGSQSDRPATFDAIHPCAILIRVCRGAFGLMTEDGTPLDPDLKNTLDAFGWLTPEGKADFAASERSYARVRADQQ